MTKVYQISQTKNSENKFMTRSPHSLLHNLNSLFQGAIFLPILVMYAHSRALRTLSFMVWRFYDRKSLNGYRDIILHTI
jgi:hypothetical protein